MNENSYFFSDITKFTSCTTLLMERQNVRSFFDCLEVHEDESD